MKVLIFLILYILIGCTIDLLITRGKEKPSWIMVIIWPMFLFIAAIIMIVELKNTEVDEEEWEEKYE